MANPIKNASQVAAHRLCIGCGACAYACPNRSIELVDVIDEGIRPFVPSGDCEVCSSCLAVCPGLKTVLSDDDKRNGHIERLRKRWGTVLEIWEGHAADPEIRYKGSSGGLCTALSLFCLEVLKFEGALHIGADQKVPWKNKTYLSRTRNELIARTGSRYSPASPCEGLELTENASKPCVFIGKPCDVAGLRMAQSIKPLLKEKIDLAIGFFCAGTPASRGTLDLLAKCNINQECISEFRYRGLGWPGNASAWKQGRDEPCLQLSYKESWGFVQKYRPFRCYLCPDLTAEFADVSFGDPWYREISENDPGQSLILVRTEKGRQRFHKAMEEGFVKAAPVSPDIVTRSQLNLLGRRQAIWGRITAMRLLGIPHPELRGFYLFENWMDLSLMGKTRSFSGTIKRIVKRNYFKPINYNL